MLDHKPVIMKTTIGFKKHCKKRKIQLIDYRQLMNIANAQENYKSTILDRFNDINHEIINSQQKWNTITDILKESAKTNVGYIERSKRSENVDIVMLSDMQRNVEKQIESGSNEETKFRLKIYWNRFMTEIILGKEIRRKC